MHAESVPSTIGDADFARRLWDVVVIGAGPAGALAARQLARRGLSVALLDKSIFPRDKVCGGCLSASAVSALAAAGLGDLLSSTRARRLRFARIACAGRSDVLPLHEGWAVSRRTFDAALLCAALSAGARFRGGAAATVGAVEGDSRLVRCNGLTARARVILAADGLNGTSLRDCPEFRLLTRDPGRIGVGALVPAPPAFRDGEVRLAAARGGYVGMVRVENDQLDIAAAFRAEFIRTAGGVAQAIIRVLESAHPAFPPDGPGFESLAAVDWRGTAALHRRRRPLATHRLFLLGDAAGYVEPFTGEGIGWALQGALAVVPLAERAVQAWRPGLIPLWQRCYHHAVGRRQRWCRLVSGVVRHPGLARLALSAVQRAPALGRWLLSETYGARAAPV